MLMSAIIKYLNGISRSSCYWLIYLLIGLALLLAALFYQHILNELPCLVCIQIRLWISLLVIIAVFGLLLRKIRLANLVINLSLCLIAVGLVERSYLLLGTERGFIFADCSFDLGLPAWFAIEGWLPWLYRVETSCGYTPEIVFGVTMAEALMLMSVLFFIVSVCFFLASALNRK